MIKFVWTTSTMLKLKLQYFDYLMGIDNSWENILMLGKTEDRRRA